MSITTQLQQLLRTLLPDKGFKTAGHHRDAIIAGVEEAKTYTDEKVSEVNGYTDQEVSELKTYTDTGLDATVKKTGNQTIGGVKTFSDGIVGNVTGNASTVTNGVYNIGNQTIGGVKTFTSALVVPDATLPQHPVTLNQGIVKTQIKQTTGTSEGDLMSQKAVADLFLTPKWTTAIYSALGANEKKIADAVRIVVNTTGMSTELPTGTWTFRSIVVDANLQITGLALGCDRSTLGFLLVQIISSSVPYSSATVKKYSDNVYFISQKNYGGDIQLIIDTSKLGANFNYSVYPSALIINKNTSESIDSVFFNEQLTVLENLRISGNAALSTEIARVEYVNDDVDEITKSANIHDFQKNIYGFGLAANGNVYSDAARYITPFYKVKAGIPYYFSRFNRIFVYSNKKTFISASDDPTILTFASDGYIRCQGLKTSNSQNDAYISTENKFSLFYEKFDLKHENTINLEYNLKIDLLKFLRHGGAIVSGNYGEKQTVYRIPLRWDGEVTIDFDFIPDFDVNTANGNHVLFQMGVSDPANINLAYDSIAALFRLDTKVNVAAYSTPRYDTNFYGLFGPGGFSAPVNISRYLENNLNGQDSFSIRKLAYVIGDVGENCEVTSTHFIITAADTTVLHSFDFATYTTIESLVAAINATTEYEAILYNYRGKLCTDLARIKIIIVDKIDEYNYDGTPTGTKVLDSFESFFPLSGKGVKHSLKVTMKRNTKGVEMIIYMDGYPLAKKVIATTNGYAGQQYLFLGGNNALDTIFDGWIENVKIQNKIVEPSYGLSIMAHGITNETITVGEYNSYHAYEKMIVEVKERGYSFIDPDMFKNILTGNLKDGDYPKKWAVIFLDDWHPEAYATHEFRAMFNRQGVKPILPIIYSYLTTATEAELNALKMAKSAGWDIWFHSINHMLMTNMTYSQFMQMIEEAKIAEATYLGFDVNAMIYPGNFSDYKTRKFLRAHGYTCGGSSSVYARTYIGVGQFSFSRISNETWFTTSNKDDIDKIDSSIRVW